MVQLIAGSFFTAAGLGSRRLWRNATEDDRESNSLFAAYASSWPVTLLLGVVLVVGGIVNLVS